MLASDRKMQKININPFMARILDFLINYDIYRYIPITIFVNEKKNIFGPPAPSFASSNSENV